MVFPWSSNEADIVVGTPSIMLSVSELDFNSFYVFSIFHVMTVFHISLLKNFNNLFGFESSALSCLSLPAVLMAEKKQDKFSSKPYCVVF